MTNIKTLFLGDSLRWPASFQFNWWTIWDKESDVSPLISYNSNSCKLDKVITSHPSQPWLEWWNNRCRIDKVEHWWNRVTNIKMFFSVIIYSVVSILRLTLVKIEFNTLLMSVFRQQYLKLVFRVNYSNMDR